LSYKRKENVMDTTKEKLIKEYEKKTKGESGDRGLLPHFLELFMKNEMDDYVVEISKRMAGFNLDPESISQVIILLGKYTIELRRKRSYRRALNVLKKWRNLEIQDKEGLINFPMHVSLVSKIINSEDLLEKGLGFLDKKMYDKAIDNFNKSLTFDPHHGYTRFVLARTYMSMDKYDDALREFDICVKLHPLNAAVHFTMGIIFSKQLKYKEALAKYRLAIQLYDKFKNGELVIKDGFTALAFDERTSWIYRKAEIEQYYNAGFLCLSEGDYEGAERNFACGNNVVREDKTEHLYHFFILEKIAQVDKKINALATAHNFFELSMVAMRLLRELEGVLDELKSTKKGMIFYFLVECKFAYVMCLMDSLQPGFKGNVLNNLRKKFGLSKEEVKDAEGFLFNLKKGGKFFESMELSSTQQLIDSLHTFSIEVKRFPNPEDVPMEKQRQLIRSLVPFFDENRQLSLTYIEKTLNKISSWQAEFEQRVMTQFTKTPSGVKNLEINFTETEVQISGQNPLSKNNPLILAEYIILRERVHWLWAFVILPEFETKEPKWQFRNYISKGKSKLKNYGIKITALKRDQDDYAELEGLEVKVKSNVRDIKESYSKAIFYFNGNKLRDAISKLGEITSSYYKWNIFTDAYMKLIEWIRLANFEGASESLITTCRDFLRWYAKRLQIGISRVEFYKKQLAKSKNALDVIAEQEFQKIKDEFKHVEDNLHALVQRIPLSKEDKEYEDFVKFLIDLREKFNLVIEKESEAEETRRDVCIQATINLQKKNKNFNKIIKDSIKIMGDELYRLNKKETYSDSILREESREIYWLICELVIELKNFDDFELKKGNKLGMLVNYFNKRMEDKIKKWLSGNF